MKFSSVVGYHMNPLTCGVAKFNAELAKRLGVPVVGCDAHEEGWGAFPLMSLKWSEIDGMLYFPRGRDFGVFWHDRGYETISKMAKVVMYADPSLGSPGLWCPSLLTPTKPRTVRLFSFGMAHKLQTAHYAKVRMLLDAAGLDYRLRVSVGLHEGTSLDDATKHFDALTDIMGADKVTILGCLSDDAVAEELQNADTVLAFFDRGLRTNNTTVHAALAYDKRVITNHDWHTEETMAFRTTDINSISYWPNTKVWGWTQLIREMEALCERSAASHV